MPRLTVVFGLILIAIGVAFYFGSGRESVTALIPAFLGIPILVFGLLARTERTRAIFMHLALVLALLGLAGTVPGAIKLAKQASGEEIARPTAALAQGIVAVLCLIYLVLGIRSFIVARRSRSE
jgi:uncharacterized membrane protein